MKLNIVLSIVLQLVAIITGLLIPKRIIRIYGSEVNGLVSWVTQMFNFFQLLEGGVSVAAAVALYKPFAEGDTKKILGIFRAIGKYYKKTGEWMLGLSVSAAVIFVFMFKSSTLYWYTIMSIVMISGITNSLNYLMLGKFNVICDADQHTYVLHTILLMARLVVFFVQLQLISMKVDIIIVELALLLTITIRLILTYFYVRKRYPYLFTKEKTEDVKFNQKNDALYIQIAHLVKRNAPMIVIGIFGNLTLLSIYNVYASIYHASSSLLETMSNSLTANFGNLVVTEEKKVSKVYRRAEWFMTSVLAVIMVCYMKLIVPFIKIYSRDFDVNYVYIIMAVLFTLAELVANIGILPRMAAISCGYIKESRNPAIIEAGLSLLLGIAGFLIWGLNGVMIGTILGSAWRTFYHIYFVSGKILKERLSESVIVLASNGIFAIISMFIARYIDVDVTKYMGIKAYGAWVLLAVMVFGVSAVIIFGGSFVIKKIFNHSRRSANV